MHKCEQKCSKYEFVFYQTVVNFQTYKWVQSFKEEKAVILSFLSVLLIILDSAVYMTFISLDRPTRNTQPYRMTAIMHWCKQNFRKYALVIYQLKLKNSNSSSELNHSKKKKLESAV